MLKETVCNCPNNARMSACSVELFLFSLSALALSPGKDMFWRVWRIPRTGLRLCAVGGKEGEIP